MVRAAAKRVAKKAAPAVTPAPKKRGPLESDPSGRKRGPKPKGTLSRDIVAEAGLAILDRSGLDDFSLRGVARELDIRPNAIYTYARSRAGLEQLVVDRVVAAADISLLAPDAGEWHERIEAYAASLREALLEHPGAAPLLMSSSLDGPNALAMGEALLGALMEAGLSGPDAARAVWPVLVYVIGSVALEVSDTPSSRTAKAGTLAGEAERVGDRRQRFAGLDEDTYPNLYTARIVIARWPSTQQFSWGLRHFLGNLV